MTNIFGNLEPTAPSPQASTIEPLGTFGRAITVEMSAHPARRTANCAMSLAVHAGIITALALLPLCFLQELRAYAFVRAISLAAVPPGSSFSQPARVGARSAWRRPPFAAKLTAPLLRAWKAAPETAELEPPSIDIPGSAASGIDNPLNASLVDSQTLVAPVVPPSDRLRNVGGDIQTPRVIRGLSIPYPEVAEQMNLRGKVVVRAIIDEGGNVQDVQTVSGTGLLAAAAVSAVAREKFVPAILNGEPTRCDLIVEVTFRLLDGSPVP